MIWFFKYNSPKLLFRFRSNVFHDKENPLRQKLNMSEFQNLHSQYMNNLSDIAGNISFIIKEQ